MRKSILYVFILIVSLGSVTCKKGEDDPAITLLSRKARLTGNWQMVKGSITIGVKDSTGAYASQVYKLEADHYNYDVIGKGASFVGNCKLSISFTKNGAVTLDQVMDSLKISANGNWDFEGKVGKNKNKERVSIKLNSINNYSNRFRTFNKAQMDFTYRIKELRNKRLVLVSDQEMILLDNSAGVYITSEYTFTQ